MLYLRLKPSRAQAALSVRGLALLSWSSSARTLADHLAYAPEQLADVEFELSGEPDAASTSAQSTQASDPTSAGSGVGVACPASAPSTANAPATPAGNAGAMVADDVEPDDEEMAPIHYFLNDFMHADLLALARPPHTQPPYNS